MDINWHLTFLGIFCAFFIWAGISHFINPRFFFSITPPWVPYPKVINYVVGTIEIALGVIMWMDDYRKIAAWGTIALLIAVFPANIYHHQKARKKQKRVTSTMIRLPVQILLIYWAYYYTL